MFKKWFGAESSGALNTDACHLVKVTPMISGAWINKLNWRLKSTHRSSLIHYTYNVENNDAILHMRKRRALVT